MRLAVQKTAKLYVGGAFVRSESGRTLVVKAADGSTMNVSRTSRKDLRDAIEKARSAQAGWAGRTAYNRGQILYRLAEMMEGRAGTFAGTTPAGLAEAIDRAVFHAGWCDKVTALLSTINPVGQAYINYSMIRPLGVVVAAPDPADGLLGLVEATCAPLVMGNAVLVLAATQTAELAVAFAECLATSDVPGGVANVLTGELDEMIRASSRHDDLDGIYAARAVLPPSLQQDTDTEAARVLRRIVVVPDAKEPASPVVLAKMAELKTVWMSAGGNLGMGGGGY